MSETTIASDTLVRLADMQSTVRNLITTSVEEVHALIANEVSRIPDGSLKTTMDIATLRFSDALESAPSRMIDLLQRDEVNTDCRLTLHNQTRNRHTIMHAHHVPVVMAHILLSLGIPVRLLLHEGKLLYDKSSWHLSWYPPEPINTWEEGWLNRLVNMNLSVDVRDLQRYAMTQSD